MTAPFPICSTLTTTAAQTGPFDPAADGKYLGAVLADPAQAAGAGVALGDGVGGDQPVGALLADEV